MSTKTRAATVDLNQLPSHTYQDHELEHVSRLVADVPRTHTPYYMYYLLLYVVPYFMVFGRPPVYGHAFFCYLKLMAQNQRLTSYLQCHCRLSRCTLWSVHAASRTDDSSAGSKQRALRKPFTFLVGRPPRCWISLHGRNQYTARATRLWRRGRPRIRDRFRGRPRILKTYGDCEARRHK